MVFSIDSIAYFIHQERFNKPSPTPKELVDKTTITTDLTCDAGMQNLIIIILHVLERHSRIILSVIHLTSKI